jgi:hypothetical protein
MTQDLSGFQYTSGFSMLFDSLGRLNVAFAVNTSNGAVDGAYHGVYDGVTWQSVRVGAAAYRPPALVLDGVGNPSVVCVSYSGSTDSIAMATRSAGVWSTQPVTSWSSNINGPEVAEAAYFDGAIHMVYADAQIGFRHGIFSTPTTPPTATITSPSPFASLCGNINVTGTASAPGGFSRYVLEYATNPNGPWTNITTSTTPVTGGTLAIWNTSSLLTGRYFLRLTVESTSGLRESVVTAFGLDRTNPTAQFTISDNITVFGGDVCVTGIVRDLSAPFNDTTRFTLFARNLTTGGSEFTLFSSSPGPYSGLLHTWRTRTGVPDAQYQLRLLPTDGCGSGSAPTRTMIVDNTPPQVSIDTPASCGRVSGAVQVVGSVQDPNISGWTLEYIGGPRTSWTVITRGVQNASGVLGTWQTGDLPPCVYALRLVANDRAVIDCAATPFAFFGNRTEVIRLVKTGCPADVDDGSGTGTPDGGVTLDDLLFFLERLDAGC